MITINDTDLPITVAEKIINAKRETATSLGRALFALSYKIANGNDPSQEELDTAKPDLFTDEEIEELAEYLLVYVKTHKETNYEKYRRNKENTGEA